MYKHGFSVLQLPYPRAPSGGLIRGATGQVPSGYAQIWNAKKIDHNCNRIFRKGNGGATSQPLQVFGAPHSKFVPESQGSLTLYSPRVLSN